MKIFNLNEMEDYDKNKLLQFFEMELVKQAVNNHLKNDEDLGLKGNVTNYKLDRDNECLYITYANGEIWKYRCIDCGPEGMLYNLVSDEDDK